uniref:Transposase n=1 Tax=Knipowitschia caucasica TaxID=637954 RepID=A0AAV2JSH5_KNICA
MNEQTLGLAGAGVHLSGVRADGKYCYLFDSRHYFQRGTKALDEKLMVTKVAAAQRTERLESMASPRGEVLHLTQIKEAFQVLKRRFRAVIKAHAAVLIKHMVQRRGAFVCGPRNESAHNLFHCRDIARFNGARVYSRAQDVVKTGQTRRRGTHTWGHVERSAASVQVTYVFAQRPLSPRRRGSHRVSRRFYAQRLFDISVQNQHYKTTGDGGGLLWR